MVAAMVVFLIALCMVFPSSDHSLAEHVEGKRGLLALERLMGLLLVAVAVQMSLEGLRAALNPS